MLQWVEYRFMYVSFRFLLFLCLIVKMHGFDISSAFMACAASQVRDTDSSWHLISS